MTGLTFTANGSDAVELPSLTVKFKFEVPFKVAYGVTVAAQFGAVPENTTPETGINVAFVEVAAIDVVQFKTLSISLIVKLTTAEVFSLIVWSAMTEIVGVSSTAVTVTWKVVLAVKFGAGVPASVMIKEIVTGPPFRSARGVTVTVHAGATPPITTPETGITAVFEEETVIEVLQATVESVSPIVNGIAAVEESSVIV